MPAWPVEAGPATRELLGRLSPDDLEQVVRALSGDTAEIWRRAGDAESTVPASHRQMLTLVLGVHHEVPEVLEKTGLSAVMPPPEVHAMARGPLAAGGDPYNADLVLGAALRAGHVLSEGATALDFGCSSGRTLRVLAAARPDVRWIGCDPNADAVAWASEHLKGLETFASPQRPPLPLREGELDLSYAISIWSHFDEAPAMRWLQEMHRVVRPGGVLVLTTHGVQSVAHHSTNGLLDRRGAVRCARELYRHGFWFVPVFGEAGDWGVKDSEWGNAYVTLEWLLARASPDWALALYEPGRVGGNQDLIVLERR